MPFEYYSVTDPLNLSTDYQYNNLNRLTNVTADGKNFTFEYYCDGMVKAVNYPQLANGTSIRTEYTYDYDNNGNIISVTENGQSCLSDR